MTAPAQSLEAAGAPAAPEIAALKPALALLVAATLLAGCGAREGEPSDNPSSAAATAAAVVQAREAAADQ